MIKLALKYLSLILLLGGLVSYFSDPGFWQRYLSFAKSSITQTPRGNWYSPLEKVPGNEQALTVASGDSLLIAPQVLAELDDYLASRNTSSFIVWHNGAIAHERYYGATTQDTPIVGKSMAKPLASLLVARAIEQNHISSLDQKAADFIHEWQGTEKQDISVRHILNMSSGLWRYYRVTVNPYSNFHQAFLSSRHEQVLLDKLPLEDTPGSHYDYSQATSDLIAILIERATGMRYAEYMSQELLQAIGAAGGEIWLNRADGMAHSGCCVMLPARTWLRLGILLAQDGRWDGQMLLPENWNAEVLKGSATNPNYSLNFWLGSPHQERRYFINPAQLETPGILQSEPYAADDLFMFDGNGSQVVYVVPSKGLVILRTGDWPKDSEGGPEWDNTLLPNTIIKSLTQNAQAQVKQKTPASSFPPPNHMAMQTYANSLGNVDGSSSGLNVELNIDLGDEAKFKDAIDYAEKHNSYGLLVWHKGALKLEKYFSGFEQGLRPETASMHKSVLALLVLAALEDGYIESLDTPINTYISQWVDRPEGRITIRQLLNMASGLTPLSSQGGAESVATKFFSGAIDARKTVLGMQLGSKPGANFSYANTNSQILMLALEKATGKSYKEYLSQRLWTPLGAGDAYVWNYEQNSFPRAYSSLLATARDWLKVGLLIKRKGEHQGQQVLSAESIDSLMQASETNSNYGLHLWLGSPYQAKRYYNDQKNGFSVPTTEPFLVDDIVYFDGFGGQRVYISQTEDLVIVRLGDPSFTWDDSALPNRVINALLATN